MNTILYIFIVLMLISPVVSKIVFGSFVAPFGIYGVLWHGFTILYIISPLPWPQEIGKQTVSILILNWVSFSSGCLISYYISCKYDVVFKSYLSPEQKTAFFERTLRLGILIFGSIGFLSSILLFFKIGAQFGFGTYITDPALIRTKITLSSEFKIGRLLGQYLYMPAFASAFFGATYIGYYSERYLPAYLPLVSIVIHELSIFARWKIVSAALIYGTGYALGHRRKDGSIQVKDLVKSKIFAVFSFVTFLGFIALTYLESGSEYYFAKYSDLPGLIIEMIMRANIPILGLIKIARDPSPLFMGRYLFHPGYEFATKVIGIAPYHSLEAYNLWSNPLAPWGERYLAISDLGPMYIDFGLIGIALIPLIIGMVSSWLYARRGPIEMVVLCMVYPEIIWLNSWYLTAPHWFGGVTLAIAFIIVCISRGTGGTSQPT